MNPATVHRLTNLEKRNRKIRDAFYERYTSKPRPRVHSREDVVAQLAGEYFLSEKTVEKVLAE